MQENDNLYPITRDKRWAKIKYEMLAMQIITELEKPAHKKMFLDEFTNTGYKQDKDITY